jgi:hypothetical protein
LLLTLLMGLYGCATPTQPSLDVGQVVVAPQRQIPPPPLIVQMTSPKAPGFYQNNLLNFFSNKQQVQTPSISHTLPVVPMAKP